MLSKKKIENLNSKLKCPIDFIPSFEELNKYYDEIKDIIENKEVVDNLNNDINSIAELFCLYFGILSLSFSNNTFENNEANKYNLLFQSIFSTITNSITSVILLVQNGLDYQANVINRQLYEMCLLLLNICLDENKANLLIETEMNRTNISVWKNNFSPSALGKTIEKYEGKEMTPLRKKIYSNYSNYAHNEFLSFFLTSFAKPINIDSKLISNLWSNTVSRRNNILDGMISFLWYTSKAFTKITIDQTVFFSKEKLVKDKELWNFSGYLSLLLDEYFMEIKGMSKD